MKTIHSALLGMTILFTGGCQDAGTASPGVTSEKAAIKPQIEGGSLAPSSGETPVKLEQAMFGAGCFWGVEATFRKVPGVVDAAVGFSGGKTANPTYKQVCYDATGHAEVVHLTYDPSKVTYEGLVEIFFKMHDPTQLNRQGPDVGDQYRSAIFTYTPEQAHTANAIIERLTAAKKYRRPIVTVVEPAQSFWKAEEYHQQYLMKNGLDNCHLPQ